jgi:hypothetical protein
MPIPRFVLTWMPAKAELDAVRGRGLPPSRQGYVTYQQDAFLEPIVPLIGEDRIMWGLSGARTALKPVECSARHAAPHRTPGNSLARLPRSRRQRPQKLIRISAGSGLVQPLHPRPAFGRRPSQNSL